MKFPAPLLALFAAFVLALVLTPIVRRFAIKAGLVDQPGGRRVHTVPTPRAGGVAIYLAFVAAVLLTLILYPDIAPARAPANILGVLICGSLIALYGLLDDKYELSAVFQLLAIVVVGVLLAEVFHVRINYVTNPLEHHKLFVFGEIASTAVTVVWLFGVTKTIDLIDGLDGLAAGICAIASVTLLIMAWQARPELHELALRHTGVGPSVFTKVAVMAAALLGASLGFLKFNYPPAKIFMGTIGAQFMGFVLASMSIMGAFKLATLFAVAVPVLALAIPISDAAWVMLKRFIDRRPVSSADKTHVHHRLLDRGYSPKQTLFVILGLSGLISAVGLFLFVVGR